MPKQTELSVSYSVGVKANIGNYESTDVHLSKSEKWDVADLNDEAIGELYTARLEAINVELSDVIESEYKAIKE